MPSLSAHPCLLSPYAVSTISHNRLCLTFVRYVFIKLSELQTDGLALKMTYLEMLSYVQDSAEYVFVNIIYHTELAK